MALNQTTLSDGIEAVFASQPATASDAATALADAYHAYAGGALFGASTPTLTTSMRDAYASTLLGAISDPLVGLPATLAAAWGAATVAYWTAVPVTGAQAGVTVPPTVPAAAGISATLANVANTESVAAAGIALALHTSTLSVTATVAPPPGTVLPIT